MGGFEPPASNWMLDVLHNNCYHYTTLAYKKIRGSLIGCHLYKMWELNPRPFV